MNLDSSNQESSNRDPRPANRAPVRILRRVIDAMIDHARRDAPLECCGLLAARDGIIDEPIPTRNVKASPIAFLIDPADHFAALKRTRAAGREIVGAYHSHPRSPAVPSPTDLAEAHYEEFLYVIVSLAGDQPDARAYRLVSGASLRDSRSEDLRFKDPRFEDSRFEILDSGFTDSGFTD